MKKLFNLEKKKKFIKITFFGIKINFNYDTRIQKLVYFLDTICKKDKNKIVFLSFPMYIYVGDAPLRVAEESPDNIQRYIAVFARNSGERVTSIVHREKRI